MPTVVEVTVQLTVDDPATVTENTTLTNAMIQGFAELMGVDASQVTLEFEQSRRLQARKLQVTLVAIFKVTLPNVAAAEQTKTALDAVSVSATNTAIAQKVTDAGFTGTIQAGDFLPNCPP